MSLTKKPRAAKPHYPELLPSENRLFWVAAYLRDVAELDALRALYEKSFSSRGNAIQSYALSDAVLLKRDSLRKSVRYAAQEGTLLFAFPGTTVLEGGAA